jgi:hypothetical protein
VDQASQIAVSSAAAALQKAAYIREVRFVLFDTRTLEHYAQAAHALDKPLM